MQLCLSLANIIVVRNSEMDTHLKKISRDIRGFHISHYTIAFTAPEEVKELKDVTSEKFPNVEKSPRDSRSYSFTTLDNGLQVAHARLLLC